MKSITVILFIYAIFFIKKYTHTRESCYTLPLAVKKSIVYLKIFILSSKMEKIIFFFDIDVTPLNLCEVHNNLRIQTTKLFFKKEILEQGSRRVSAPFHKHKYLLNFFYNLTVLNTSLRMYEE